MLLRLFYFLLAIVVAWHASPALTRFLSFLPLTEIVNVLRPRDFFGHSLAFYLVFLLAAAVLWEVLKSTGLAFLPAGPQRYGNTKLVRRVQGLIAEAVILALFMAPVIAALVIAGPGRSIILSRMERELGSRFADAARRPMLGELHETNQQIASNDSARGTLKVEKWWEGVKDWFRPTEQKGVGVGRVERQIENTATKGVYLRQARERTVNEISDFTDAYESRSPEAVNRAREAAWAQITGESRWRFSYLAFKYLWWLALPMAAPFYFFFNGHVKAVIARMHRPVLRFIDTGRGGVGGSARFAGMLEEWELIYGRNK